VEPVQKTRQFMTEPLIHYFTMNECISSWQNIVFLTLLLFMKCAIVIPYITLAVTWTRHVLDLSIESAFMLLNLRLFQEKKSVGIFLLL
jgi:hypothetical protein